jgi:hypothetical protein
MIFPEICKMRGLPAWDVILPKEEVPKIWPGLLKLTVLNALKASTRNCSENRSVSRVFFLNARSVSKKPGAAQNVLSRVARMSRLHW